MPKYRHLIIVGLAVLSSSLSTVAMMRSTLDIVPKPLYASASSSSPHLTMATVPVDEELEAVVVLDHDLAELRGFVLNRYTGRIFVRYRFPSLLSAFGGRANKNPQFSMVAATWISHNPQVATKEWPTESSTSRKRTAAGWSRWVCHGTLRYAPTPGRQVSSSCR